jgi:BolA family transcriptional regulator, general stress-responsive regulator
MRVAERIRESLEAALEPVRLDIVDESHLHAGHAGARPGGESHFRVTVVSERFAGLSRVRRQQAVYAALAELMRTDIHALAMTARTPEEDTDG